MQNICCKSSISIFSLSEKNVVMVSLKPANVSLITGKVCMDIPPVSAPWVIFNFLHSHHVDFGIVDKDYPPHFRNLILSISLYSQYFKLVKKIGSCYLYRFNYE